MDAEENADDLPAAGEPELPSEPDEQVALERLTAAFAELLGGDAEPLDKEDVEETVGFAEESGESEAVPRNFAPAKGPSEGVSVRGDPGGDGPPFPISPQAILEAMLFVGDPQNRPLSPRQAAARLRGVSPREIESLVEQLNAGYCQRGCPYTIESSGEGYRMVLREEFASVRERFYGRIREARLSQSAIDILALVAYHQPMTRNRVDEIRGKPSGGILGQLVRRQLLSIERTDGKPRVTLYRTTDRFLDLFGLEDLDDLPRTQDLEKGM